MSTNREEITALAAHLVDISSVSRGEGVIAAFVESELCSVSGLEVTRVGDNVVARTALGASERLLLAGHLDTVPPGPGGRGAKASVDGGVLSGLGAVDMKGGVAAILSLARRPFPGRRDATFVLYAREEVSRAESGLLEIAATRPELLVADAAVLCEPTNGIVEAGCQGVLRARVEVGGRRAHAARPWVGVNAIHRLAAAIELLAAFPGREPVVDGCTYRESLQAVGVEGGEASNVVPERSRISLTYRFAPDRDVAAATAWLEAYFAPILDPKLGDALVVEDAAPSAAPSLRHPALAALVDAVGAPPSAKLGWTDVAFFAERGVPAANFGPGDPLLAHTDDERVAIDQLVGVTDALAALLDR